VIRSLDHPFAPHLIELVIIYVRAHNPADFAPFLFQHGILGLGLKPPLALAFFIWASMTSRMGVALGITGIFGSLGALAIFFMIKSQLTEVR
jgi:hypothetical protein